MPFKNKGKAKKGARKSNKLTPAKVQSMIKKTIYKTAETKLYALETAIALGANQGQMINVSGISTQGTDNEQRIGDLINGIGLELRLILQSNFTIAATGPAAVIRMVVFRSSRNEFSTINDNLMLTTANEPTQLTTDDATDLIRSLNKKQFNSILYDKSFKISAIDNANSGQGTKDHIILRKFFKFNSKHLFPVDGSGEAEVNNLRVMFIYRLTASGATQANNITGELMTRFYYKDF